MKIGSEKEVLNWLKDYIDTYNLTVEQIKFSDSNEWDFKDAKSVLSHRTNGFFSITGLMFTSNFYNNTTYYQPIINQPEIGILGFLAQIKNDELYLLAQAKTEPGNVNTIQLAPTLQATESNYKALHGGTVPEYLNYFLDTSQYHVLVDQLQSEQGTRFYKKRNRNMVVLLPSHVELPDTIHHKWISINLWKKLFLIDHLVNTDSRSVIAGLLFSDISYKNSVFTNTPFSLSIQKSLKINENSFQTVTAVLSWITKLKSFYTLERKLIPLSQLKNWEINDDQIIQPTLSDFSIRQYRVHCASREVVHWDQPLINTTLSGFVGLIGKNINGILHFLLQAKVEPGNFDKIELTSTVHQSMCEYELKEDVFLAFFNDPASQLIASGKSSEEGGRFHKDENVYKIVLIEADKEIELPINYTWLTLNQISLLMRFNNFFTNEVRSLFALMSSRF